MRTLIIASLLVVGVPSFSQAQSDLQKIGKFLQDVQRAQQQQSNNNIHRNQGPPQGTRSAPYSVPNPNSSGNQNRGDFNRNNFFGPQNGNGNQFPQNHNGGRVYVPQHNGMSNNRYVPQNQNYPGNVHRHNGQVIYPQNNGHSSSRPIYSDPPSAPRKVYSRLPIVVRRSHDGFETCNYELITGSGKSFPYTINEGQSQNLTETTDWNIRYRATPSSGSQTYRLRGGKTYEMRKAGHGWQLYMVP